MHNNKKKIEKLLEQYAWQFKLLDDVFARMYRRSDIIVKYYINHFDDFLKLNFKDYNDKKIDMLSFLKKNYYKKYFNSPEKLLRKLEVDWANVLAEDYVNSYIAAKKGMPKELQELHNSID